MFAKSVARAGIAGTIMAKGRTLSGILGLAVALWAGAASAEDQKTIVAHGISTFGSLKLPADFAHLSYVNPDAPKGGEISEWAPGTFDSVNPYTIKGIPVALGQIFYESILSSTADEIGASYCHLCETMEYPEDRSWVIFNLRHDVTFSDGSPMTADDVVFSYELFRDKGIAEFRAVFNAKFDKVEALDPYRVKFTFTPGTAFRDMPAQAGSLTIVSKADYLGKNRDLEESSLEPFLGTGPYVLDSLLPGQQVVYRRNPDYWGAAHPLAVGRNNFDRIRIEYFGDDAAAMEGFKSGVYTFRDENSSKNWATGYDFPGVTSGQVVKATLPSGSIASGQAFLFNLRRPHLQDPRVREAIGLMFNFEWSNQTLFYGLYARVNSIWENTAMAAHGPASVAETAILQPLIDEGLLDPTILTDEAVQAPQSSADKPMDRKALRRASALLDAAGWTVGAGGMRRNAKGEVLKLEFIEDSPAFERVISPYVENLRALGVDAQLVMVDSAQLSARIDPPSFDFDVIVGNAVNGGYEPGAELKQAWASVTRDNSSRNRVGFAMPAVDRLLDMVEAAKTRDELDVVVQALDRVLRAQKFWVPQWYKNVHTVAYYDMYDHPENLPPYDLGELDFWWFNPEKAAALQAAGALK